MFSLPFRASDFRCLFQKCVRAVSQSIPHAYVSFSHCEGRCFALFLSLRFNRCISPSFETLLQQKAVGISRSFR